jgi:hypothetical protein
MSHIETGNTKLSLPVFVDIAAALETKTDDLLQDVMQADRSCSVEGILRILGSCTTQQLKIMEDILKAVKISLEKYL